MKKIYLDWNVINHLEEIPELYEYILNNQSHFVFVYSPAHFSDLMRSYQKGGGNAFFEKDLDRLETVCETHLMRYFDKKMNIHRCPPREFLEKEGKDYPLFKDMLNPSYLEQSMTLNGLDLYDIFCESLKSFSFGKTIELPMFGNFSNAFELLNCSLGFIEKMMTDKDFVKSIRAGATNNVNDKEIACINNYNPGEVIGAINAFFKRYNAGFDLEGLINKVIIHEQQGNELLLFECVYAGLDLMRYHSDKRTFMNILTDADHAFYGSYCDVLVTDDAKMRTKTEAVYSYFGIETKIIRKKELLDYLTKELQLEQDLKESFNELLSSKRVPKEYDNNIEYSRVVLEHPFLSYYNILEHQVLKDTEQSYFLFARDVKKDKFIYYTETEKLFEIIKSILCDPVIIEAFEKDFVEKYYSNDRSAGFRFYVSNKVLFSIDMSVNENYPFPLITMLYLDE